jgi:hypothetical protein
MMDERGGHVTDEVRPPHEVRAKLDELRKTMRYSAIDMEKALEWVLKYRDDLP